MLQLSKIVFAIMLASFTITPAFAAPNPIVALGDSEISVPTVVEPGEEFTIPIRMINGISENGYGPSGVHLHIDAGDIIGSNMYHYTSYSQGIASGMEWIEFYDGNFGWWETKKAYVTIKAPSTPGGAMNIYYRGWMRDSYTCPETGKGRLYRDPDDPSEPEGTCNPQKYFMDYATYVTTITTASIYSDIRNLDVSPTTVSPGGTLTVTYEFYGTGGNYPYETQTILIDGSQVACYSENQPPNQWYPRTRYVTAPASAGSHTLEVRVYGDSGYKANCGSWDDKDSRSFTVSAPPVDPNPDGDDLTSDEEQHIFNVGPVYDANGNPFPNPNKTDAFKPVHAAELYYQQWYYNNNPIDTSYDTEKLAAYGIYFAELYKQTSDTSLKQNIKLKLEATLDELINRQQQTTFIWSDSNKKVPEGRKLDLKGHISPRKEKPEFDDDLYTRTPLYVGPAAMALLEGYDALGTTKYKDAGLLATDMCIRWLESRGFDSNGGDDYTSYLLLLMRDPLAPEKWNHGGDEYMSTANHYGSALLSVGTAARVTGGAYTKQVEDSDMDSSPHTYAEIAEWIVGEVRRLQRPRGVLYEGGIRDGPLDQSDRLLEHIWYAGMTAHGVRKAYEVAGNQEAYTVLRELAAHYWAMRQGEFFKPKGWWDEYDFDILSGWPTKTTQQEKIWASIIELAGEYTRGFRQAMVDYGSFLRSTSTQLRYVMPLSMKMKDYFGVIIPINETEMLAALGVPVRVIAGYSNPIIYQNEIKTISVLIDPTVGRLTAEVNHNSSLSILKFSLYTPNGTKITESNYNSFSGVNYTVNGTYMLYTVDNPASGSWKLELEAVNVPAEGELYYMMASFGSTLDVSLQTDMSWYLKGELVKLTASVINDTEILSSVSITGKVTKPGGTTTEILFYDDGTHVDKTAGDGESTASYNDTIKPGFYDVEIETTGNINGKNFLRKTSLVFEVVGEEERKEAFFAGLIRYRDYHPGDTVSGFFYVGNEGNVDIDDELHYTIKGPTGQWMYRKWEPIYLEPDEVQYLKFSWDIPQDAPSGNYMLKVEFDDPDIEGFPLSKWFWVGGLNLQIFFDSRKWKKMRRKGALILIIILLISFVYVAQKLTETTESMIIKTVNEKIVVSKDSADGFNAGGSTPFAVGFNLNNGINAFEFKNNRYNITVGSHYFKLFYEYNYVNVTKYSQEEFPGWNLKIIVEDLGDKFIFNITYKKPIQNERAIKKLVSDLKVKRINAFSENSNVIDHLKEEKHIAQIIGKEGDVLINKITRKETYETYKIYGSYIIKNETALYENQDLNIIKNKILDEILRFDFTNEGYVKNDEKMLRESELGLEREIIEEASLMFEDNSVIRISYYMYGFALQGALNIGNDSYFFSHGSYKNRATGEPQKEFIFYTVIENVNS